MIFFFFHFFFLSVLFSSQTGKPLFDLKVSALFDNLIAITKEGQVGIYNPSLHTVGEFYTPSKKMKREILWSVAYDQESVINLLNFGTEGDSYVLTLFTVNPTENTIARNVTFTVNPPKDKLYPIACDFDTVNNKFILTCRVCFHQTFLLLRPNSQYLLFMTPPPFF